jgi:hypothetical protein
MDKDLLEVLLHQDESETLDFKADQYAFEGVDDTRKGEILKDILAFANSWRREDAYILIGVEEVRGGRSTVCGTSSHLLNRNLQQFVNSKVNRPITFSYTEHEFEAQQVGILSIPVQDRPFFLLKDFGRLKAKAVYIRRGDTTDEATPDEVFRMGSIVNRSDSQPALELVFADLQQRTELGGEITLSCTDYSVPDSIPDYGRQERSWETLPTSVGKNFDYLRDIADFVCEFGILQPVGFAIHNPSTTAATNVCLRFRIASTTARVLSKDGMPSQPSTDLFGNLRRAHMLQKKPISVTAHGDFYEVRVDIGTVQPGMTEWSPEDIFIGSPNSFEITVEVTISADNLRFPEMRSLGIRSVVESRKLPLSELKKIAMRVEAKS